MGMFSWDCHCCGRSLRNAWGGKHDPERWRAEVVVIAQDGTLRQGRYNGYGSIGRWKMPKTWDYDDGREWVRSAEEHERDAERMRTVVELIPREGRDADLDAMLRKSADVFRESLEYHENAAREHRAFAAECAAKNVAFTAYHRRCWEHAERPGFQGQSKRSEDQGS